MAQCQTLDLIQQSMCLDIGQVNSSINFATSDQTGVIKFGQLMSVVGGDCMWHAGSCVITIVIERLTIGIFIPAQQNLINIILCAQQ